MACPQTVLRICEMAFRKISTLNIHFNFQKRLDDTRKSELVKRRNSFSFFDKLPDPLRPGDRFGVEAAVLSRNLDLYLRVGTRASTP